MSQKNKEKKFQNVVQHSPLGREKLDMSSGRERGGLPHIFPFKFSTVLWGMVGSCFSTIEHIFLIYYFKKIICYIDNGSLVRSTCDILIITIKKFTFVY